MPSRIGYYLKNDYRIKYLVFNFFVRKILVLYKKKSGYYNLLYGLSAGNCGDDNDDDFDDFDVPDVIFFRYPRECK